MEAEKLSVKKHKKSSKRLHSFSSRSDDEDSRKNGYFKPSSVSSKKENLCDKSYLDVKEDRTKELESRIERKRKKGKVKERRSENEEYSSSSSSESQKQKKKIRKEKKRKEKKRKKKHKKEKGVQLNLGSLGVNKEGQKEMDNNFQSGPNPAKSTEEQKRRMAPMTKEEYDIQQSKVRRVLDPDTGRERLIKGDGEIIEDIVSYERHKAINKLSTAEDGVVFQKSVGLNR